VKGERDESPSLLPSSAATFAGMIRLIPSLALAVFLTVPSFAQEDDALPPLPTRAEVLAEIEAVFDTYVAELEVDRWYGEAIWEFLEFDITNAIGGDTDRDIWLDLLDRAASEIEDHALDDGAAFQPLLSVALFYSRLGAEEQSRRMLSLAAEHLDAGIGVNEEQIARDRDRIFWMAHLLGHRSDALEYSQDVLEAHGFANEEPYWLADYAVTMAVDAYMMGRDDLSDRWLTLYSRYSESASEDTIAVYSTFSDWRAGEGIRYLPSSLIALDNNDRINVARFLARTAQELGDDAVALDYLKDAYRTNLSAFDSLLNRGAVIGLLAPEFAESGDCDTSLAVSRTSFAWEYVEENEFQHDYPSGTIFDYPMIYTPDGATIIHMREYLGWPGGTIDSRRIQAAVVCGYTDTLIHDMQMRNTLYREPHLLNVTAFIHAEGLLSTEQIAHVRIAFFENVDLPLDRDLADNPVELHPSSYTGANSASFPADDSDASGSTISENADAWVAQAAYWSAGARLAGQDAQADQAVEFVWRLINEAEGVNRLEALAWLAIAIPE